MELLGAYLAIQQIQRGLKPNNIPHLFEKGYSRVCRERKSLNKERKSHWRRTGDDWRLVTFSWE